MYIYIYIYIYVCVYVSMYIYPFDTHLRTHRARVTTLLIRSLLVPSVQVVVGFLTEGL